MYCYLYCHYITSARICVVPLSNRCQWPRSSSGFFFCCFLLSAINIMLTPAYYSKNLIFINMWVCMFIRADKQIKKSLLCPDTLLVLGKTSYFLTTLTSGILALVCLSVWRPTYTLLIETLRNSSFKLWINLPSNFGTFTSFLLDCISLKINNFWGKFEYIAENKINKIFRDE